jgi:hypothetical protein
MSLRRYSLLAVTGLGLAACERPAAAPPSQPPPPPAQVEAAAGAAPEAFQGEWNIDLAACGSAANESRLVIQPRRIRFFESSGPIDGVVATGPRDATFKVTLSAEGETVQRDYRFRLSPDGRTLTDIAVAFDRKRCPS